MVKILTKWSYLIPFLSTREKLHLQEIANLLKSNHTTVRLYLNEFEKQGILKKCIKGRLTLYQINKDSELMLDALTLAEKENLLLWRSNCLITNGITQKLQEKTSKPVIIFGSSVENPKNAQDIDILTSEKNLNEEEIEKTFRKKLHVITVNNLSLVKETLKEEVFEKHIIINNTEEVVKWLHLTGAKSKKMGLS